MLPVLPVLAMLAMRSVSPESMSRPWEWNPTQPESSAQGSAVRSPATLVSQSASADCTMPTCSSREKTQCGSLLFTSA